MTTLPALKPAPDLANLTDLMHRARRYVDASRAPSTRIGYECDWRMFSVWAAAAGLPFPYLFHDHHLPTTPMAPNRRTSRVHASLTSSR